MTARLEQSSKRPYAASHGLSRLRQKQASAEYRNAQRGSYSTLPVKTSGDTIFIQTLVFLMRKHNCSYILPFPQPGSPDSAFFHSEAEGHGRFRRSQIRALRYSNEECRGLKRKAIQLPGIPRSKSTWLPQTCIGAFRGLFEASCRLNKSHPIYSMTAS